MNTNEQKQLIEKMQMLRDIKPRREWAVLLKHQILASPEPAKAKFVFSFPSFLFQRKLAYSFATLLLIVAGLVGFAGYTTPGEQTASLSEQTELKQNVVVLNSKIRDLAQELKKNPVQDPQTIKDIVASLKTLAYVPGIDSTSTINANLQDLYGAIVVSQIKDLQKTTLTDAQQEIILEAIKLYNDGKYSDALEKVLTIDSQKEIN